MINKKIVISESVQTFLNSYSSDFIPKETGGIIIGFQDAKNIYITHATEAGPKAIHQHTRFVRDQQYTKMKLDKIFNETNGKCDYLGEWHSHTMNCSISPLDIVSIYSLGLNPFNKIDNPLLLININEGDKWRKNIYRYEKFAIRHIYLGY